tara:strand:+ start:719 stop:1912 length:1194 start_codon:yes stop_codon:yes gene_type:complete
MTRKGVWNIQGAREKDQQNLWAQFYTKWGIGPNDYGQLGTGNRSAGISPNHNKVIANSEDWVRICQDRADADNESNFQLCIKNNGSLWSWGDNGHGQLGHNNRTQYSSPVQIPGTTWANATSSCHAAIAVKTDGTMWSWGKNTHGQMGVNQPTNYKRSSPVQIPGTTWSSEPFHAAAGVHMFQWIKTDGTLWEWGANEYGQLGQNNRTNYSSPRQVGSDTTWDWMGGVQTGVLAGKTDGTMWGWGANEGGILGLNNRTNYSSPKQIPGTTWSGAVCAGQSSLAVKTDGTLWTWGNNSSGKLGLSETDNRITSSPEQLPGTTWTTQIGFSNNGQSCHAIKSDGTMWGWGDNDNYELGIYPITVKVSSPTQVGTESQWHNLSSCYTVKLLRAGIAPSQL